MSFQTDTSIESEASKLLLEYGFPVELRGYEYLRKAIVLAYNSPELTEYVTKALFPRVARLCNSSYSSVARGCRHVIEYTLQKGALDKLLDGYLNGASPSSALVISELAKRLHDK